MSQPNDSPLATVERLRDATNAHDLERVVACFAGDYVLEAPTHPERSFRGNEQVRRNWSQIFAAVPDITTRLVGSSVDGDTAWTEWEMSGTRRDGAAHFMRGVFIFGVKEGVIRSGRMFLEPVQVAAGDMTRSLEAELAPREPGAKR